MLGRSGSRRIAITAGLAVALAAAQAGVSGGVGAAAACASSAHSAKSASCRHCDVSLKGTVPGDTNPQSDGVGLTAGFRATLKARVTGCRLPSGARLVIRYWKNDSFGHRSSQVFTEDCGHVRTCTIRPVRQTPAHFTFQARIVGCPGAPHSKKVDVVWAPKEGGNGSGGNGSGGSGNGNGTPTWVFNGTIRSVTGGQDPDASPPPAYNPPAGCSGAPTGVSGSQTWDSVHETTVTQWDLPSTITAGSTGRLDVTETSKEAANNEGYMAVRPDPQFGVQITSGGNNELYVPANKVGQTASDHKDFSFTPTTGQSPAKIRIDVGDCGAHVFYYDLR